MYSWGLQNPGAQMGVRARPCPAGTATQMSEACMVVFQNQGSFFLGAPTKKSPLVFGFMLGP